MRKWMLAIWLIMNHKKGIANTQLAKDIGVTQKSTWFKLHRLRHTIRTRSFNRSLDSEIETDEIFVGGKKKNRDASKRGGGKQGRVGESEVFGMLERGGELRTNMIPDLKTRKVQCEFVRSVKPDANMMIDKHGSILGLQGRYSHHRANLSAGENVQHFVLLTARIASVWTLFKR